MTGSTRGEDTEQEVNGMKVLYEYMLLNDALASKPQPASVYCVPPKMYSITYDALRNQVRCCLYVSP